MTNPDSAYKILHNMKDQMLNETRYTQMYYQLLLFRSEDLCCIPHRTDSIIRKIMNDGEMNGDKRLLMSAYYCMGCYYRDKHDAQQALIFYQKALDSSEKSKDYALIARIYSQMGHLQLSGYSYEQALPLYQKALYYFKLANDSLTIPSAIVDLAHVYEIQHQYNAALSYYKEAYTTANSLYNKSISSNIDLDLINLYYKLRKYDSAKMLLSSIQESSFSLDRDKSAYYLQKGYLYRIDNKTDSAVHYLNKAAQYGRTKIKNKAYRALCELYCNKNNSNLALKYALLNIDTMQRERMEASDEEIAQLQSLYNYSRVEEKSRKLTEKNKTNETTIFLLTVVMLSLCLVGLHYRHKDVQRREIQRKVIEKLKEQYKTSREYITAKEKEIERLREQKNIDEKLLSAKTAMLQIEADKSVYNSKWSEKAWKMFRESDVYNSFHHAVSKNEITCNHDAIRKHFNAIKEQIDLIFDDFGQRLQEYCPDISKQQIKICYLIKAEFSPSEMGIILFVGKQAISNIRSRMAKKFFSGINTSKTFDEFIHDF